MGEPVNVVRMTISVPRALKARMDAADGVNWSAVASQAFEAQLLELTSRMEVKGMDEVIARMKAAQALDDREEYQEGRKAGDRWAKQQARPKQLQRLEQAEARSQPRSLFSGVPDAHGWPGVLWQIITGGVEEWDRDDIDGFWKEVLGDDDWRLSEETFARGFFDGAMDVWDKVSSKL